MHDVGNGCPYLIHYTCNDPSAKTSLRDSITRLPFSSSTEWSQPTASTIPAIRTLSSDNGLARPCLGQDQYVHLDLLLSSEHTWGCRCSVSALVILLSPCGPLEDRLEHSPPPAWNSFKLQSATLISHLSSHFGRVCSCCQHINICLHLNFYCVALNIMLLTNIQ